MRTQHTETSASVPTPQAAMLAEANQPAITPGRCRFVTVKQAATMGLCPFSELALYDLKFKAFDRKNSRGEVIAGNGTGPAGVWIKIGSRVLVDLDALDRWIESRKVAQADD